jgi:hypothetical protein
LFRHPEARQVPRLAWHVNDVAALGFELGKEPIRAASAVWRRTRREARLDTLFLSTSVEMLKNPLDDRRALMLAITASRPPQRRHVSISSNLASPISAKIGARIRSQSHGISVTRHRDSSSLALLVASCSDERIE